MCCVVLEVWGVWEHEFTGSKEGAFNRQVRSSQQVRKGLSMTTSKGASRKKDWRLWNICLLMIEVGR